MSKRLENREKRRLEILEAARRTFAERGPEETSMAHIAEAAGCARRTLYAYFESWDELAMAVTLDDIAHRWQVQKLALDQGKTGLEKLRLWGESYYRYTVDNPYSVRFQFFWDYRGFHDSRISEAALAQSRLAIKPVVDHMLGVFCDGQADGSINPDLDAKTCMGQYAYTLRAILNRALFPAESFAEFQPDDFVQAYIDHFLRGLVPAPEGQS